MRVVSGSGSRCRRAVRWADGGLTTAAAAAAAAAAVTVSVTGASTAAEERLADLGTLHALGRSGPVPLLWPSADTRRVRHHELNVDASERDTRHRATGA